MQYNLKHLCDIHQFIFKDVYAFAGKLRDEDISKGNFRFTHVRFMREFIRCLALESGYVTDWSKADASTMLTVMIESPYDNTALREVLYKITTRIKGKST